MILRSIITALLFFSISQASGQHCNAYKIPLNEKSALDSRSDSVDILHTHLNLDFSDFGSFELNARADIDFESRIDDLDQIEFDLLELTVDSVTVNNEQAIYTYNGLLLNITLETQMQTGEEAAVSIYYSGTPTATSWGGFYWNSNYAYNLGVGLDTAPHNLGRAWFPCFDNFTERCSFSFEIKTLYPKVAVANGVTESFSEPDENGNVTSLWSLEEEIPSYLASIAVGDYGVDIDYYYSTPTDSIPMWLVAPETNLEAVGTSFTNLGMAMEFYEEFYGPYEWPRVGYAFVPFNNGAMEHATNIAYPLSFADGSLSFETLMAHELAHHWWGDLVTCSSSADMWINEGMASFSEALFLQQMYGEEAYIEWIMDNHRDVLTRAHKDDGDYMAVSGVGQENTYGSHVYNKGANMGHCLRSYMGDEAFKTASTSLMSDFAYNNISSIELANYFQEFTNSDIISFFDNWIFQPGFTDFSVTAFSTSSENSTYTATFSIEQRLHEAFSLYENMPVQVTFVSADGLEFNSVTLVTGNQTDVSISGIPFEPEFILLNRDYGLTPAVLAEEKTIYDDGIDTYTYAEFRTDIDDFPSDLDSIWLRVECHFTGPRELNLQDEVLLSSDRFWTITGNIEPNHNIEARIRFYGDADASIDYDADFFNSPELNGYTEDDLILFFRPLYTSQWTEFNGDYEISNQGSSEDFIGRIDLSNLKRGEYCLGVNNQNISISEATTPEIKIFPNPSLDYIRWDLEGQYKNYSIKIINNKGQEVLHKKNPGEMITVNHLTPGKYALQLLSPETNLPIYTGEFIIIKE